MRTYIFVDAENHYRRSVEAAKRITGSDDGLETIATGVRDAPNIVGWPLRPGGAHFFWKPKLQLFWDTGLLSGGGLLSNMSVEITRAMHVGSYVGDLEAGHVLQKQLREYSFEPLLINEPKNRQDRRDHQRNVDCLMDKAKGCDIMIATRMVAAAAADLFDCCFLFTSDADFLPAVEAVRGMGKVVWVFGYQHSLGKRSPYDYAPDRFVDLEPRLRQFWEGRHNPTLVEQLEMIGRANRGL